MNRRQFFCHLNLSMQCTYAPIYFPRLRGTYTVVYVYRNFGGAMCGPEHVIKQVQQQIAT
jgi:hypothetical protein